jgi:hypothetical protein
VDEPALLQVPVHEVVDLLAGDGAHLPGPAARSGGRRSPSASLYRAYRELGDNNKSYGGLIVADPSTRGNLFDYKRYRKPIGNYSMLIIYYDQVVGFLGNS